MTTQENKMQKLAEVLGGIRTEYIAESVQSGVLAPRGTAERKHPVLRGVLIAAAAVLLVGVMVTGSVMGSIAWKRNHPAEGTVPALPVTGNADVTTSPEDPVTDNSVTVLQTAERTIHYPIYAEDSGTLQGTREEPLRISVLEYPQTGEKGISLVLCDGTSGETEIYSFRGYGCVFLGDFVSGTAENPLTVTNISVLIFEPQNTGAMETEVLQLTYDIVPFSNTNYSNKSTFRISFPSSGSLQAYLSRIKGILKEGIPEYEIAAYLRVNEYQINTPGAQPLTEEHLNGIENYVLSVTSDADSWKAFFQRLPLKIGGRFTDVVELQSFQRMIYAEKYDPVTKTSESVQIPLRIALTQRTNFKNEILVPETVTGEKLCPEEGFAFYLPNGTEEYQLQYLNTYTEKPSRCSCPEDFLRKYGYVCMKDDIVNGVRVTKFLSYQFTPDYRRRNTGSESADISRVARITTEALEFYFTENAPPYQYNGRFYCYQPSSTKKYTYELTFPVTAQLYIGLIDSYKDGDYLLQYGLNGVEFYDEGRKKMDEAEITRLNTPLAELYQDYFPGFTFHGIRFFLPVSYGSAE